MRTLLVLCAGNRRINHIPVFMNRHPDGKLLAEKAIEGVYSHTYERIIYVITKSIDEEFNAIDCLAGEIDDVEVVCISEDTNGPADTVFYAIEEAQIEGEFAVRDCLNSIEIKNNAFGNFVSGLDLTTYNQEVFKVRTKSFIVVNEQNQILDIVEKRFRSDVISVGLYGFNSADDFIVAYKKLKDPAYHIKKIYLSNIISYLIGYSQRVFHCVPVIMHEDWGCMETWNQLQREYATCIIDADGMIGDILTDDKCEQLISLIVEANNVNMHYVVTTAGKVDADKLKCNLISKGVNCAGVIIGISQSNKKIIVSSLDELRLAAIGG